MLRKKVSSTENLPHQAIKHRFYRYLLLIPIVVLIAHGFFSLKLDEMIRDELLDEKFFEKNESIDLISTMIADSIVRGDEVEDTKAVLIQAMNVLDRPDYTFAAAYNSELKIVSERTYNYDTMFEPMVYPEFRSAVQELDSGNMTVVFFPMELESVNFLIYFKWVPLNIDASERLLSVIAVSEDSLTTQVSMWAVIGNIFLSVVTAALNFIMVWIIITRLQEKEVENERE